MEAYKKGAQKKFSLLETGIIQKPSTRLLLINVRDLPWPVLPFFKLSKSASLTIRG